MVEIAGVPSSHPQTVSPSDRGDLTVENPQGEAELLPVSHDLCVESSGLLVERQDPLFESGSNEPGEAILEIPSAPAVGKHSQAVADLSESDRRQEQPQRVLIVQPLEDRSRWSRQK